MDALGFAVPGGGDGGSSDHTRRAQVHHRRKGNGELREALEKKRRMDEERHHFHDLFMHQDVRPDILERVSALVRGAAEHGQREVLALRFPSEYCTDGGRAINSFEPTWAHTLTGFAKRVYEFWQQELEPLGYRVRAQIMDYPGGMPGDGGSFSGGEQPPVEGPPSGSAGADRRPRRAKHGRNRVSRTRGLRIQAQFGDPGILFALVGAALLAACEQQADTSAATAAAPPPAVTVVSMQPTEVTPGVGFNGRVVAVDEVQLRARVTGFLERRLFEEGADVDAGDLLFVIEKAPYQAVVEQRQAELASAQANRANTAVQLQRAEELVKNNNIPQAEVDQRRAADQMAAAQILEAQAALEQAQISLGYTEIHAPLAGRIGRADLSVGNLVGLDSGVLATIVSQDPIYVTFPVSQRQLLEYRRERGDTGGDPVVRVTLPDGTLYQHPGQLNFLDVQVDPGTDTVTVRAELPNPERVLVDGQFVGVRVERGAPERVLAVPQAALQVDQAGPYVLVVGGDDKVEARRVSLGDAEGAQVVVERGLNQGERVIVEGIQKVRPGMAVAASEAPPATPTPAPGAGQPPAEG
jgi:membrane fusion protein, multidrug efflux system